ncbi:DNA topoisomerase 2 top-2-like [Amblyomma americanum]
MVLSASGEFRQMSFVSDIATTKGCSNVDCVADHLVKKIKDYQWMFVNCLIENPTFDSQTKESITLLAKKFGSNYELSEKVYNHVY